MNNVLSLQTKREQSAESAYPERCLEFAHAFLTEEWPRLEKQVKRSGKKGKVSFTFELGYTKDEEPVLIPNAQVTPPKTTDEWIGEFSASTGQLRLF